MSVKLPACIPSQSRLHRPRPHSHADPDPDLDGLPPEHLTEAEEYLAELDSANQERWQLALAEAQEHFVSFMQGAMKNRTNSEGLAPLMVHARLDLCLRDADLARKVGPALPLLLHVILGLVSATRVENLVK